MVSNDSPSNLFISLDLRKSCLYVKIIHYKNMYYCFMLAYIVYLISVHLLSRVLYNLCTDMTHLV